MASLATVCEVQYDLKLGGSFRVPRLVTSSDHVDFCDDELYNWTVLHARDLPVRCQSSVASFSPFSAPAPTPFASSSPSISSNRSPNRHASPLRHLIRNQNRANLTKHDVQTHSKSNPDHNTHCLDCGENLDVQTNSNDTQQNNNENNCHSLLWRNFNEHTNQNKLATRYNNVRENGSFSRLSNPQQNRFFTNKSEVISTDVPLVPTVHTYTVPRVASETQLPGTDATYESNRNHPSDTSVESRALVHYASQPTQISELTEFHAPQPTHAPSDVSLRRRAHTAHVTRGSDMYRDLDFRLPGSAREGTGDRYKRSVVWVDSLNEWIPEDPDPPRFVNFVQKPSINLKSVSNTEANLRLNMVRERQSMILAQTCTRVHPREIVKHSISDLCARCRGIRNANEFLVPKNSEVSLNTNVDPPPARKFLRKPSSRKSSNHDPIILDDLEYVDTNTLNNNNIHTRQQLRQSVDDGRIVTDLRTKVVRGNVYVDEEPSRPVSNGVIEEICDLHFEEGENDIPDTKPDPTLPRVISPVINQPSRSKGRRKAKTKTRVKSDFKKDKPAPAAPTSRVPRTQSTVDMANQRLIPDVRMSTSPEEVVQTRTIMSEDSAAVKMETPAEPSLELTSTSYDENVLRASKSSKPRRAMKVRDERDTRRRRVAPVRQTFEEIEGQMHTRVMFAEPMVTPDEDKALVSMEPLDLPDLPTLGERKPSIFSSRKLSRSQITPLVIGEKGVEEESDSLESQRQQMSEERRRKLMGKMSVKAAKDKRSPVANASSKPRRFDDCDFLSKYCIFQEDSLDMYTQCFEAIDEGDTGFICNEDAQLGLRVMNGELSTYDLKYMTRILDLVGYNTNLGADLKLFSVMAALSAKIASLDDWMKTLVFRMDMPALEHRIYRCKTLWECNVDPVTHKLHMDQLCLDLRAGGVSDRHEKDVMKKLSHLVHLDLLDFLTYIPLFLLIHASVLGNPLDDSRDK